MKRTIEWLLETESFASETYRMAAEFFKEDSSLGDFLTQLAEDESWHHRMLAKSVGDADKLPPIERALEVDDGMKQEIERPLKTARELLTNKSLTKEAIIETVITAEFSEWNDIFVYVMDSLRHNLPGFQSIGPRIQHHIRWIENFMESQPDASRQLQRIRTLPTVWKEHILVVDDFEPITELLEAVLTPYGLVETAADGAAGLEKALGRYYAVIISDVDMPVMNGLDFYRALVEQYPQAGHRFLFLSGNPGHSEQIFFRENNLLFMEKPAALGSIKKAVFQLLNHGAALCAAQIQSPGAARS